MKPVIIIGAGGHARVLYEILQTSGCEIVGVLASDDESDGFPGVTHLEIPDSDLESSYGPGEVELVNGIGSVAGGEKRRDIYRDFKARGYRFASAIHRSAVISRSEIAEGVQIAAGAIIGVFARIGENSIVNTGARIDHDCEIAAHCHIAPGAVLSGTVTVGEGAHIGAGSVVIQGISIGEGAVVGAGAVVIRDVPAGATVVGNPARVIKQ